MLLHFFQLDEHATALTDELSRGMRKKLALCAALLHGPTLFVLDEPFESLDPLIVKRLEGALVAFARAGGTVLLSSHLLDAVEQIWDRVLLLVHGTAVVCGETSEAVQVATHRLGAATLEKLYSTAIAGESALPIDWMGVVAEGAPARTAETRARAGCRRS